MIKIRVEYFAQLRDAAGRAEEVLEFDDAPAIAEIVEAAARAHADALARLLTNEDGRPHPWILVSVNDALVRVDEDRVVDDGDIVVLSSPISGG